MNPLTHYDQIPGTLMNFRIQPSLKSDFQKVCRNQHISMTARLNLMIREFLEEQKSKPSVVNQPPEDTGDAWRDRLYDR